MSADIVPTPEKKILRSPGEKETRRNGSSEYPLSAIEDAVRSIRYGTVQIVIQDGHIVQIDKTEKIRLR